jgi:hypothetical protein
VEEWLRERRNALIDGAIIYVASKWVVPETVAALAYLASTPTGLLVLTTVVSLIVLVALAPTLLEQPLLRLPAEDKDYEWVYLYGCRPAPAHYMLGSRGTWMKVRRSEGARQAEGHVR